MLDISGSHVRIKSFKKVINLIDKLHHHPILLGKACTAEEQRIACVGTSNTEGRVV